MIVKHFGCTTIHNKALYKCIIHSFIQLHFHIVLLLFVSYNGASCFVDSSSKSLSLHILLLWVFQVVEEGEGEAVEEKKIEEEAAPEPEKAE